MLPPLNPYIAGAALSGERGFFGRNNIIRKVKQILRHPTDNAIILYGQRRIGKTSVLLQLQHRLSPPDFVPIYFDLMDMARLPINQVLYNLAVTAASEIGLTFPKQVDFTDNPNAFDKLFLPKLYEILEPDCRPVFLFDEFDVLDLATERDLPETAAARAFRPYLYHLLTTQPRLAFVLVFGRRMEDMSVGFSSTLKAAKPFRISFLKHDEAGELILQAEQQDIIHYDRAAVDRIMTLTRCHPYLTQLVCQILFDRAFDLLSDEDKPNITVADIESAIPDVLEIGGHAFRWIWDGLPPAERIIFSAIASQSSEGIIFSEDDVISVLQNAGIRILMQELDRAPKKLVEWQMLEQIDGGYRFMVELLRRWVAENRPLNKVKDELDRINPRADMLYQIAVEYHRDLENAQAISRLREALNHNPNHVKAHFLLGIVLREENRLAEAVVEFEKTYQLDEREGRYELLMTLLQYGEALERDDNGEDALAVYDQVLKILPSEQTARNRRSILIKKLTKNVDSTRIQKVPMQDTVEPFGRVIYWDLPNEQGRVVRANILMYAKMEGVKVGIAIDGSGSMEDIFGKKPLSAFLPPPPNQVKPVAQAMSVYLAKKSIDKKVTVIYWATDRNGNSIEILGDLSVNEAKKFEFNPPTYYGTGTQLLPALKYFTDGKQRDDLYEASWGMYVFITDGAIDDLERVEQYCMQLAKDIKSGQRNNLKLVIIGLGNQVYENQLESLHNLKIETDVDLWDGTIVPRIQDLPKIFTEVVGEEMPNISEDCLVTDDKSNVVADYQDTGLPNVLEFVLPADAKFFSLHVAGKIYVQQFP